MQLFRIVKTIARTRDLSGIGAYRDGGRWNNKGTYMLYTSENSSLAYLESLVHFDKDLLPPWLYVMKIEIDDKATIYDVPEAEYPTEWQKLDFFENKTLGDRWMNEGKFLGIKVKSAINITEYNFLLNPLYPGYVNLVNVIEVTEIPLDDRLIK